VITIPKKLNEMMGLKAHHDDVLVLRNQLYNAFAVGLGVGGSNSGLGGEYDLGMNQELYLWYNNLVELYGNVFSSSNSAAGYYG
tara:strand:+ start:261 stop:512 length:252 start_codon:yes stop_codon:yes gene_type:complete